jgi:hypothetical protein
MMAKGEAKIREQARSRFYRSPVFVGAALAANIPERKVQRRIRGQARSYKILSKPRIAGAALAANIPERRNPKYELFR